MRLVLPAFVAVILRVEVHGRVDIAMPQHPCIVFGSTFPLFTSQVLKLCRRSGRPKRCLFASTALDTDLSVAPQKIRPPQRDNFKFAKHHGGASQDRTPAIPLAVGGDTFAGI
jgi:hypothetical protein